MPSLQANDYVNPVGGEDDPFQNPINTNSVASDCSLRFVSVWKMERKKDQTNLSRVQAAIAELGIVEGALAGEFTVAHLITAEGWTDRFECLKWAVECQATVAEMKAWHRAQNGLDLFMDE